MAVLIVWIKTNGSAKSAYFVCLVTVHSPSDWLWAPPWTSTLSFLLWNCFWSLSLAVFGPGPSSPVACLWGCTSIATRIPLLSSQGPSLLDYPPCFVFFLSKSALGVPCPAESIPLCLETPQEVPCPPGQWGQHGPMAPIPVLGLSIMPNAFLQLLNLLPWTRCNFWSNVGMGGPGGLKADLDVSWQPRACSPGCWS